MPNRRTVPGRQVLKLRQQPGPMAQPLPSDQALRLDQGSGWGWAQESASEWE